MFGRWVKRLMSISARVQALTDLHAVLVVDLSIED